MLGGGGGVSSAKFLRESVGRRGVLEGGVGGVSSSWLGAGI